MLELKGRYCKDCKIFTDNIEEEALSIVYRFLDIPQFKDAKIRIMPDVHAGNNIVVGFTVPFKDAVNPDHVGGDIGCTVSTAITDIPVNPEDFAAIEHDIRQDVKFGLAVHDTTKCSLPEMFKHLGKRFAEARQQWPDMVLPIEVNEKWLTDMMKRCDMSAAVFYHSIGSVGSGNHFVEVGETPEHTYAITVHCGSRNLGQKVWKYWRMVAKQANYGSGFLQGEEMRGYITDMVVSQAYAEWNHIIIQRLAFEALRRNSNSRMGKIAEQIITTHNYIDFRSQTLRKGAVAALEGEKLVIPFNMKDGLIVCKGKSNPEWNCSAPHGAGRLMSRSMAKEMIDMEEYKESMKDIYSTSVNVSTIDESPMAYKDPKEILSLIEDTVEVLYFIRPVINMKASSGQSKEIECDEEED